MHDTDPRPMAEGTSRRKFLQASVVTAAALAGSLTIRRSARRGATV
jgi:hypothetical protein